MIEFGRLQVVPIAYSVKCDINKLQEKILHGHFFLTIYLWSHSMD